MTRPSAKSGKNGDLAALGAAIRSRRKEIGMSQECLAATSGVERAHMGKTERGENNLSILSLLRIATALGCLPSVILVDAGL